MLKSAENTGFGRKAGRGLYGSWDADIQDGRKGNRQIWDTVRLRRKQLRGLVTSLSQKIWQKILLAVFMYIRRPRCKI